MRSSGGRNGKCEPDCNTSTTRSSGSRDSKKVCDVCETPKVIVSHAGGKRVKPCVKEAVRGVLFR
jgi:hypothetical protein